LTAPPPAGIVHVERPFDVRCSLLHVRENAAMTPAIVAPPGREDDPKPTPRTRYRRLRNDVALRRTLALLIALALVLAVEILLLLDLRDHAQVVTHGAMTAAAIVLAFTMVGLVARLPALRRRVKPRFVVRPFGTLSCSPAYDGGTLAALLHRDLVAWPVTAQGGVAARTAGVALPAANVSLGVTSLPLDWLWSQLRHLLTGRRDIIIEGILLDAGTPLRLQVWTSDSAMTWQEDVAGTLPDALDRAIAQLTPRLLETIEPELAARIHWNRLRHDDAIRLITAADASPALQLELAEIKLDGDYLESAERLLDQLAHRIEARSEHTIERYRLQAELAARRGRYEEARELFACALAHPRCSASRPERIPLLRGRLGDLFAFQRDYDAAIAAYNDAYRSAGHELRRLTGEADPDRLDAFLDQRRSGTTVEIINALWTLLDIVRNRAFCRARLDDVDGGLADLESARVVLERIRSLEADAQPHTELQAGVLMETIADGHLRRGDIAAFDESVDYALGLYDHAILLLDQTLASTPDDMQARLDIAWSHCGRAACLLRRFEVGHPELDRGILTEAPGMLQQLLRDAPAAARRMMFSQLERARAARAGGGEYASRLEPAAAALLEALLAEVAADELPRALRALESWQLGPIDRAPTIAAAYALEFPDATEERLRNVGLEPADAQRMHATLVRMLHVLVHQDGDELRRSVEAADLLIEGKRSFDACERHFAALEQTASKRLQAEAWYGRACVYAVQNDADMAVSCLVSASDAAGEGTVQYLNRALLNPDFDAVRAEWVFRSVLPPAGSAAAAAAMPA
jgi:tetratricopeptide (TPR) repeat protein